MPVAQLPISQGTVLGCSALLKKQKVIPSIFFEGPQLGYWSFQFHCTDTSSPFVTSLGTLRGAWKYFLCFKCRKQACFRVINTVECNLTSAYESQIRFRQLNYKVNKFGEQEEKLRFNPQLNPNQIQCTKKVSGHLHISHYRVNKSCNLECCGNKIYWIVVNMMSSQHLQL